MGLCIFVSSAASVLRSDLIGCVKITYKRRDGARVKVTCFHLPRYVNLVPAELCFMRGSNEIPAASEIFHLY